jgi:lysophospholipase L1-like esterase
MSILVCALSALLPARTMAAPPKPAAATPAAHAPSAFKTVLARMELKDGDSVVFLGDSITHQCLYTQYVEDFYYTRYPKLRIHFHNAGVGGDRASDALARFDGDVAVCKPRYVTLLLGMNDGAYRDFDKTVFDTYQKDMTTLLDRIAALGATAIPMTPTIFDSRAARMRGKPLEPRDTYYNGVLALYGAWLR